MIYLIYLNHHETESVTCLCWIDLVLTAALNQCHLVTVLDLM